MSINLSPGDLLAIIGIVSVLGSLGIALGLSKGKEVFAPASAVSHIDNRLGEVEQLIGQTVKHSEMGEVYRRLSCVEQGQAVLVEKISHVQASNHRIEGKIDRFSEALMQIEKIRGGA